MDLILANSSGAEERTVFDDFDIEVNLSKNVESTFQVSVPIDNWDKSLSIGKLIYIPYTEYGGVIKSIETNTDTNIIYVKGYTWRGYLSHRFILPPDGEDYYTVSGELNAVINEIVGSTFGSLFQVSEEDTGVTISSYQFARYVNMNVGLSSMLATEGYRLDIKYVQTDFSGYVMLSAQPADTYADDVELSQDMLLDFSSKDYQMGINHLICLGSGEPSDRVTMHLYVDGEGNISQTKTFSGIEEIVGIYEDPSADAGTLQAYGTDRLNELKNSKTFQAKFNEIDEIELDLGDVILGTDYITGITERKPIARKILNRTNGVVNISYKIEGEA